MLTFNLCLLSAVVAASALTEPYSFPSLPVGLWRHQQTTREDGRALTRLSQDRGDQHYFGSKQQGHDYPAHTLDTPINHFQDKQRYHPHVNGTFPVRYWFDDSFYEPGGPIFVLLGGETSGEDRLQFLDTGILDILSRATSGMGVILEHRYYGDSVATEDLSTESLRFLSTEQSLADCDYWVKNVQLPKLNGSIDLGTTPVIFYGGSYAGGQAAFMRHLYPETVYGAIASSGAIHAQIDSWQYFEPIRQHGPKDCIDTLVQATADIDKVLVHGSAEAKADLKAQFGLSGVSHDDDFVNTLSSPLGAWQGLVWKQPYEENEFYQLCDAITKDDEPEDAFRAYAQWIKEHVAVECPDSLTQDECFGTFNATSFKANSLDETWRLWTYQYCTEWGYFMGGAPEGHPSLVSRLLDVPYNSRICQFAFDLKSLPNITEVNQWGSYALSDDRLAFIDGTWDPWLFITAHAQPAPARNATLTRPYYIIPEGVHHSDEYGNPAGQTEPDNIRKVHALEVDFVQNWLADFDSEQGR